VTRLKPQGNQRLLTSSPTVLKEPQLTADCADAFLSAPSASSAVISFAAFAELHTCAAFLIFRSNERRSLAAHVEGTTQTLDSIPLAGLRHSSPGICKLFRCDPNAFVMLSAFSFCQRFFQNCRRRREESLKSLKNEPRYLGSYRVWKKPRLLWFSCCLCFLLWLSDLLKVVSTFSLASAGTGKQLVSPRTEPVETGGIILPLGIGDQEPTLLRFVGERTLRQGLVQSWQVLAAAIVRG
jgi:hypothetical protein